jgi:hypothetical protein
MKYWLASQLERQGMFFPGVHLPRSSQDQKDNGHHRRLRTRFFELT